MSNIFNSMSEEVVDIDVTGTCDNCKKTPCPVLIIDTSADEYEAIVLCQECINEAFKRAGE